MAQKEPRKLAQAGPIGARKGGKHRALDQLTMFMICSGTYVRLNVWKRMEWSTLSTEIAQPGAYMLKSELIEKITEQNPHLYERDVEAIVNAILNTITNALARADRVELRDFGVFTVKTREARTGR